MEIDVAILQEKLDEYRCDVDGLRPINSPHFKSYLAKNRKQWLEGLIWSTEGMMFAMHNMTPNGYQEAAQLAEARRIVLDFAQWAKDRRNALG